jgi:cytochrome c peroxidase
MKRKILIVGIAACLAGLLVPVINLFTGVPVKPAYAALPADTPEAARARDILGAKCLMCHCENPALPFYAKMPVASSLIGAHIRDGTAISDLEKLVAAGGRQEIPLAKLEQSIALDTMPILPFMLAHWNGALTAAEKSDLLAWIRKVRVETFSSGLAAPAFAAHVVQPLPAQWPTPLSEKKVALGDRLYNDKRLSGDDTVSCASCHDLAKGGTDQLKFSVGVRKQVGGINAPTVFNAAYNFVQFWDGRAKDLADQADGPPLNPVEMDGTWPQITGKLAKDADLTALYKEVYGSDTWVAANIRDAIAEFEKTLITPGSGLDLYLMGDNAALAANEAAGHDLFLRHSCATCHAGESLGGQSFEKPVDAVAFYKALGRAPVKDDYGRFNETKAEADRFKMKVPNLRNLTVTFPYLHDGSQEDLADVVRLMHDHFVPELNRHPLPDEDAAKIVALLKKTTGTLHGRPL